MANRLAQQTSPYLQEHADNPVDWYAWGTQALTKAQQENKPILLSIGYSACHWCHVMAQESFTDQATADIMNQFFINIKVDREERPDLDKIYQLAHQLLTGRPGGWPLTIFLHAQTNIPFFSGTYFPNQPRYQLPSFKQVLQNIASFYHSHQTNIGDQAKQLQLAIQQITQNATNEQVIINFSPLQNAMQQLTSDYDHRYGGFGNAPKFPQTSKLELLLYVNSVSPQYVINHEPLTIVNNTLEKMGLGGIYDQLGGGFFRYSVDESWQIPHFEKMLYDNALLLSVYADAHAQSANPLYEKVLRETAHWVIQTMQSPEGGYYSAIDADSEGKEGYFYIWRKEQLLDLLTTREYNTIILHFNLQQEANFEDYWHFNVTHTAQQIAELTAIPLSTVQDTIHTARMKLLQARQQRQSPKCDKKILTAWNALMIKAMIKAGIQLKEPDWIQSAERALNFIYQKLWDNVGLRATYKDGHAHLNAYLDDYAFLLDALLTILQYRWQHKDFLFAKSLSKVLLKHFYDPAQGNFFFVTDDHEKLLYRPKTLLDEAMPAGNSKACLALQRLGFLLGETKYLNIIEFSLQKAWLDLTNYPGAHASLQLVLLEYLEPPEIIIIRGEQDDITHWQAQIYKNLSQKRMVFAIDATLVNLPANLAEKAEKKTLTGNKTVAYVCKGHECSAPITTLLGLEQFISDSR